MKQHKLDRDLPHSIVFYDHSCGFCRREMMQLKKRDALQRLHLVDISAPQFDPKLWGVSQSEVEQQLHTLTPSGEWLVGMPAIRHVYSEVGLGWLWWSTKLPLLDHLSQRFYRWFARNRMAISRNLGMKATEAPVCETGKCNTSNSKEG